MRHLYSLFISLILLSSSLTAANFKSGEEIKIQNAESGDYYIGGGDIEVLSPISGDLVIGGGEVIVNDSVSGDILAGCGRITINGMVGDDIRISGGEIDLNSRVIGDVFIFGGEVHINQDAEILGDLVIFGGDVKILGGIGGNVKCYSGNISFKGSAEGDFMVKSGQFKFDGPVNGNMEVQAEYIEVGDDAHCNGNLRYWHADGEIDFTGICENAVYDEELAMEDSDTDFSILAGILGIGLIVYWIIFILSSAVVLWLLDYTFGPYFELAAREVRNSFVKSLGYGMIYFIGIPILTLILFITLVGFPLGVLTLSIYSISLLFATWMIGLTVSYYFRNRSEKGWTESQTWLYALLTVVILKIVFMIPLLGATLKTVAMAAVYGTFFMMFIEGFKKRNVS